MWIVIYFPIGQPPIYYGPFSSRNDAKIWLRNQKSNLTFEIAQVERP